MPTADEILARATRRTETVSICPDGQLVSRFVAARRDYQLAASDRQGMLADTDEVRRLKAEVERLAGEVDAACCDITFTEIPPGEVRRLRARHTLASEQARKRGMPPGSIDSDEFLADLACQSVTEPEFSVEQMRRLLDANEACRITILEAVDRLHAGGGVDPKRLAAVTGRAATSGSSSTQPPS